MTENPFKNSLSDAIIDALPLADYISKFAVRGSRQSSRGSVLFHSPFREDRNASLSVTLSNNLYFDFAENKGGNIITFCARYHNISNHEAVLMLADEAGLNIEDFGFKKSDVKSTFDSLSIDKQAIINVNLMAQTFYEYEINLDKNALNYIKNVRHFSNETINEFKLGFASSDDLYGRLITKGIPISDIIASKLSRLNSQNVPYNFFSNRLIIPIHDQNGILVGFAGRALDNESSPKYKNSESSPVFDKKAILFNEYKASNTIRSLESVIVMEGYFDVISAWQYGIKNAVASMGVSFNEAHYNRLSNKAKTVYVCFDSDPAGIDATVDAFKMSLEAHRYNIRAILIPKDKAKDVDEFLFKYGVDEFNKLIDSSVNYLEYMLLFTDIQLSNRLKVNEFKHEFYSIMNSMKLSLVDQYYYLDKFANFVQTPFGIVEADYRESQKLSKYKSFSHLSNIKKADLIDSAISEQPSNFDASNGNEKVDMTKDDLSKLSPYKIKDKNESFLRTVLNNESVTQLERIIEFKLRNPFISFSNILFTHLNLNDKLKPQKLYFSHDFKTLNEKCDMKFNREYINSLYGPERYGVPIYDGKSIIQVQDLNVLQRKDGSSISKEDIDCLIQNYVTGGYKYLSYDVATVSTAISNILTQKDYGDMASLFEDDIYTLSEDASSFLLNPYAGVADSLKSVAMDILTGYILQLCKDTDITSYASRISNNLINFFNQSEGYSITESLDKLFTLVDYKFKQISNQCEFLHREQQNYQYQNEVSR